MREKKWNLGRFIGRSSALLLLFALLFLPSAWAEEGENLPKIIIGSDEYQPYSYYNVDGSPQGVDVELAREAFRRMGYEPVFRHMAWEDKDEALANGEVDCLWSGFMMNGREDKCGGHEYMQKLIAAMDDSELIIFCAPTYVYHIPGQVKTLLDHFAYRWLVHRPDLSLMRKQALIITTAAGGGMKSTVRDLRDSMNYWGVGRTHVITQAVWGYDWSSMPENFMRKIEQKVEKTVSAIRKNAGNVTPCAKVKGLFYMYRLFHKKRKMNPVDDEYWYQKGYVTGKPWKRGR